MKAMILAAGYGSRLHPLTLDTPKALVKIAGQPLLDRVLAHLHRHQFNDIAINVHHHAEQVIDHLHHLHMGNVRIHLSVEEKILGTGGGIKKMIPLLGGDEAILVYNVDVLTGLDLTVLYQKHISSRAAATLVVQSRETKRYLLFDEQRQLCGRMNAEKSEPYFVRPPVGGIGFRAFNGIQVIDPAEFLQNPEEQFSSIDLYLRLAQTGKKVAEYRMDGQYWRDLGRLSDLEAAEDDIKKGHITLDDRPE